ncbi:hypothetical protein CAFE_07270 [Caprobacter fermentans]|uniref:AlgX/AlgJ SGNH hydrolase-like domain-containing protein n=1 Tax=Caproicibacter fermentans TaxID=2576756 RepID=A0A6N8HW58_9FIRM|nr:DHHW family protein [Caproicibacter fermentans]MVB10054.1 hypothetical protein [Caproicibacter fermentans]
MKKTKEEKVRGYSPKQCTAVLFILLLAVFFLINLPMIFQDVPKAIQERHKSGKSLVETFEDDYNQDFFNKNNFISLNGLTQKLLGHRMMNNVVKLNNGYLTETVKQWDVTDRAAKVIALNQLLAFKKTPFLYVEEPYKIEESNSELPIGLEDFSNSNADRFLAILKKNNVPYLDLREKIREDHLNYYSLFFRTDHHWLPTTGFWAYTKIAGYLQHNYGWPIKGDYLSLRNYQTRTYKQWFLGSLGKRVSPCFDGVDDFPLIYPKFETDVSVNIPSAAITRRGSFYPDLFNMEQLRIKDYWNRIPYGAYGWGDRDLTYMKNYDAPVKKKILVIKDSFALTITPFLLTQVSDITMVDFRYTSGLKLKSLIDSGNYDSVIISLNPDLFENDLTWNW